MNFEAWKGFCEGDWQEHINVRDFINKNYTAYEGDASFLAGATERTKALNARLKDLQRQEREAGGVLSIDVSTVSSLCNYPAGYIDKENELIVGLQTDEPLKRGVNPFGGIRMARSACEAYGYKLSDEIERYFTYRTTHNDGVFRVYSDEMKAARHCALLTGLPDAYGRGRIIGDYRRIALYGVDALIEQKKLDKKRLGEGNMDMATIKLCEELYSQIDFLGKLKKMAGFYGCDISLPAKDAREAIQWTYFGYLAANKEQNGAAMSFGRCSTFFDIYIERDMRAGILTETEAQELIDDLVIKLRTAR
ncbi:MAG: formate acetyltransferase, partial [Clostridia bacterium]|nr:formate acetyltransferase [Clostridia bacterium]